MANYFYIEAIESGTVALSKEGFPAIIVGNCFYSINDNTLPSTSYTYGTNISLNAGDRCYFRIDNSVTPSGFDLNCHLQFSSSASINVGGSLVDSFVPSGQFETNYYFCYLFKECEHLIDASKLRIINNSMTFNNKTYLYAFMFYRCTSLLYAPRLADVTVAMTECCYRSMFSRCSSLIKAPDLPAITLAVNCYYDMFYGCSSLIKIPYLPATTLPNYCYGEMFKGCSSLKISATKVGEYKTAFKMPWLDSGTIGTDSMTDMFASTGGTFTGTPSINTYYYGAWSTDSYFITSTRTVEGVTKPYLIVVSEGALGVESPKIKLDKFVLDSDLTELRFVKSLTEVQ